MPTGIASRGSLPCGSLKAGLRQTVPNVPGVGNWLIMLVFVGGAERHVATGYFAAVHVEKSLPSKEVIGLKILDFTKGGPAAIRDLFGTIADTLLEPHLSHENAHLITSTLIRHVDWKKLAQVAA